LDAFLLLHNMVRLVGRGMEVRHGGEGDLALAGESLSAEGGAGLFCRAADMGPDTPDIMVAKGVLDGI
jgi:hypothetical protein